MDRFASSGIVSTLSDQVQTPSISHDNQAYAGWSQFDAVQGTYQVWVAGYENGLWNPFLGQMQSQPSGCSTFCGLNDNLSDNATQVRTLLNSGTLHVAWQEGSDRIVHKTLTGSTWSLVDNLTGVQNPDLVLGSSSVVLTYDNISNHAHYRTGSATPLLDNVTAGVSTWDGSGWRSIGVDNTTHSITDDNGTLLNKELGQVASSPTLVSDGSTLYAVWLENSGSLQIRVSRNTGSGWEFIDGDGKDGLNINTARVTSEPHGVVFNGKLYLTWTEANADGVTQIRVAQAP